MKFTSLVLALFMGSLNAGELDFTDLVVKSVLPKQECRKEASSPKCIPCKDPYFSHGDEALNETCPSAYNFPASVRVKCPYHVFSTISYLYWLADQEGMDIATTASVSSLSDLVQPSSNGTTTIFQPMDFTSGFKMGLGGIFGFDQWVLRTDYTYLRQSTEQSVIAPDPGNGIPALYFTSWFDQVSSVALQGLASTDLYSKWHLSLNWLDLSLSRPFYSGRNLILIPFMGLRGSWMNQSLKIRADNCLNISNNEVTSQNHSHSWGLGPRGGAQLQWLIGSGWKVLGDFGASLLFTQYTHIKHSETLFDAAGGDPLHFSLHNYNCIRPTFEAKLGLGWGTYFLDHRYHVDLSFTYDWNYLISENMIRYANDQWIFGTGATANALSVQGLTISARFDF